MTPTQKELTRAQQLAQMEDWQRRLMKLLGEIEEANGPNAENASKLEHLVRFSFEQAYAEVERLKRTPEPLS